MFSSTFLCAHFGISCKNQLDRNVKMHINSKNAHKNVCVQLSSINFLSDKKKCETTMETHLTNKFHLAHQKSNVTLHDGTG